MIYPIIKRGIDVIFSVTIGIALLPVYIVIAFIVKASSPGSVFFRQKRIGRAGAAFVMFKFRTMRTDAPKDMPTHLFNDPYSFITPIGRFLRKSSLDELPQLWNIIVGDMSIVGPRPALWNQFDLINARKKAGASELRPGLTGWGQVNGNKNLTISEKAAFDGEYARRIGFLFDTRIFLMTFYTLLSGKGMQEGTSISNKGEAE